MSNSPLGYVFPQNA